jgi:Flp pilus assembly protein TadG
VNRLARAFAARNHRPRGQGLVEFSLALPVFLFIIIALIDTGRGVFTYNTISQSAREGARLGAVEVSWLGKTGVDCTAPVCPANTTALRTDVVAAVNRMSVGLGTIPSTSVFIHCHAAGSDTPVATGSWNNCASSNTLGNLVTVRVDYTYKPIIGAFIQWATAGTMALSADTTMAIN